LAALEEMTGIHSGPNIEHGYKLFYKERIDQGKGGDEALMASVGRIIIDLQDNMGI